MVMAGKLFGLFYMPQHANYFHKFSPKKFHFFRLSTPGNDVNSLDLGPLSTKLATALNKVTVQQQRSRNMSGLNNSYWAMFSLSVWVQSTSSEIAHLVLISTDIKYCHSVNPLLPVTLRYFSA